MGGKNLFDNIKYWDKHIKAFSFWKWCQCFIYRRDTGMVLKRISWISVANHSKSKNWVTGNEFEKKLVVQWTPIEWAEKGGKTREKYVNKYSYTL